ncbi:hypothetical protein [Ruegeria meonggei]|uniref:hypothetical protein n=1 Tax=Ruegeria meonggei TaxID=1446476 RepID=UPI003671AE58
MVEATQNLFLANPLEFYTAVVATLGVAFWFLDRRSMKAALEATRGTEINSLRTERQRTEANVEKSFAELQMKCQFARDSWRDHEWRNGPQLRDPLHVSEEQREIQRIELAARLQLERLKETAPSPESFEIAELEAYFSAANRASLQFAKLTSQLPVPKRLFQ